MSCSKPGVDSKDKANRSHKRNKLRSFGIQRKVKIKKVAFKKVIKIKNFNSVLNPKRDIFLTSQSSGLITKLNVDMGNEVKKGNLIAIIDISLKKIDLEMSKVVKEEAQAQLKYVKDLFEKDKILIKNKIINQEAFEASKNKVLNVSFAYKKASLSYDLAKLSYDRSFIYAPFSGVIVSRLKQKGDIATVGMPLVRLVDNENLESTIGVTWEDLNQIKLYSINKEIKIVSPDNKICNANIVGVSDSLDAITNLYPIKLNLNKCDFINGTSVKVSIPIKEYDDSLELKREFLDLDGDYYLFIYENNKAVKRKVEVLDDNDDEMIIRLEHKDNEKEINIITEGHLGLLDNESVSVVGDNESN